MISIKMDDYIIEDISDPFFRSLLAATPLEKVDISGLIAGTEKAVRSAWISPSGEIYRVPPFQHESVAGRICAAYGYLKTRLEMMKIDDVTLLLKSLGWVRVWSKLSPPYGLGAEPSQNLVGRAQGAFNDLQIAAV